MDGIEKQTEFKAFQQKLEKDISKHSGLVYSKSQVNKIVSETIQPLEQSIAELTNEVHQLTLMING